MIKRVFILENPKIKEIQKEKEKLEKLCKSCGKVVEKQIEKPDLIITMGGDGTILKAVGLLKNEKTLIYGIKYGKIGFMTNTPFKKEEKIKNVFRGKYKFYKRMLLELNVKRNGENIYKDQCLNDFLISRKGIRIVDIELYIGSKEIMKFRGDGIIISTPTGSTAHSLSAGGPIIQPDLDSILIVPMCPYSLSTRPLVLSPKEKIKIRIIPEGKVISDGQREFELTQMDEIYIKMSKRKAKIIIEDNFFEKLKAKFNFGK
ncbi:MAG: NAD(+)/NADH kinase [Candidatus Omnitrophica bacterium]|nr:NAD(+)/NADH kinase [Candidatus Omnitrophota bacterium]